MTTLQDMTTLQLVIAWTAGLLFFIAVLPALVIGIMAVRDMYVEVWRIITGKTDW